MLQFFRSQLILAFLPLIVASGERARAPRFERVYALQPEEGVFAYARISPDGRHLAYASEDSTNPRRVVQTVTVVDLKTKAVLFTEPGIDAFWSNDGRRMIYLGYGGRRTSVSMRHHATGDITRDVAPSALGDYFSWGVRAGRNVILTINSNYYYLGGDTAVLPASAIPDWRWGATVALEGWNAGDDVRARNRRRA
jgi:hypothetical protein